MQIIVLNGSPRGDHGVTRQYVAYLQKRAPKARIDCLSIGQAVDALAKHEEKFNRVIDAVRAADAVLWAFPVFFMHLPAQLLRFIQLVEARRRQDVFASKYVSAISTSVHFHDDLPHRYLQALCEDWGMIYYPGYSAAMDDLTKPAECEKLMQFIQAFLYVAAERRSLPRRNAPVPARANGGCRPPSPGRIKSLGGSAYIAILTDARPEDQSLRALIDLYRLSTANMIEVINLRDLPFNGGCVECYRCAESGVCARRDEAEKTYRNKIMASNAVIYATSIQGRFISGRFKEFIDRGFFNGHRAYPSGMQAGCLISGPLRGLPDVRDWFETYVQCLMGTSLCPIVTDEDPQLQIESNIVEMARQIDDAIREGASRPVQFPAVAGHLILRDMVFQNRWLFREDYRYYKKNGLFDYPQRDGWATAKNTLLYYAMGIPSVRREFEKNLTSGQLAPLKKVVEKATKD